MSRLGLQESRLLMLTTVLSKSVSTLELIVKRAVAVVLGMDGIHVQPLLRQNSRNR